MKRIEEEADEAILELELTGTMGLEITTGATLELVQTGAVTKKIKRCTYIETRHVTLITPL